jgi:hypothetical protein
MEASCEYNQLAFSLFCGVELIEKRKKERFWVL